MSDSIDQEDLKCCGNCKHFEIKSEQMVPWDDEMETFGGCNHTVNFRERAKHNSVCINWEFDGLSNINRRDIYE
jgi:hypothetical protein